MTCKETIMDSWISLYPEYSSKEDSKRLIKNVWGEEMEDLAEQSCRIRNNPGIYRSFCNRLVNEPDNSFVAKFAEKHGKDVSMFGFYVPILNKYLNKYSADFEKFDYSSEKVIKSILESVSEFSLKTLVLEINESRKSGILKGDTSEERYSYYENTLLYDKDYLADFYSRYYVLVELLERITSDCIEYQLEILENYYNEAAEIQKEFPTGAAGKITDISMGAGDKHNGKSVAFVTFENDRKLIYKPHSLTAETGFHNIINWINENKTDDILDMKSTNTLNYPEHGWSEIIDNKDLESEKGIVDFYIRAGQLLCILYTMNTVDCHFENIISSGAYPVLIDCETLFHPYIVGRNCGIDVKCDKIYELMTHHIDTSVLKVGMLPNFMVGGKNNDTRFDISGLGECENIELPFRQMKLEDIGKDTIKITYDFCKSKAMNNCPVYNGKKYSSYNYSEQIKTGFRNMYLWLLKNKETYLDLIINNFSDMNVRLLFRATHMYSRLLLTSFHPDFLKDAPSRKAVLARIGINSDTDSRKMVSFEVRSLEKGNVPLFSCKANSKDVYSDDIPARQDYLEKSPLDYVTEKISEMSEENLNRQLDYISMSFNMTDSSVEKDLTGVKFITDVSSKNTNKEHWLETAIEIGDYLIETSSVMTSEQKTHRNWISCTLKGNSEGAADITPIGYDVYNGSSGIILFLTKLGEVTGIKKYIDAAGESMNSIAAFIDEINDEEYCSVGLCNGISGYLYAISELFSVSGDTECIRIMNRILEITDNLVPKVKNYDIISGVAGCLSAMINIYENEKIDNSIKMKCKTIAEKCINKIISDKIEPDEGGITWESTATDKLMTGFAHGNAGIIAVLSRAQHTFGIREDIKKTIDDALVFERKLFNKKDGNWYINNKEKKYGNGWCHGVPGILLEKTELLSDNFSDDKIKYEYQHALNITKKFTFGIGPSLCHGDLGNIQIVHYAATALDDKELEKQCENTFSEILRSVIKPRYKGKSFRGTSSAGLFIGTSGFGYTILQMLFPEKVKMILGA